MLVDDFLKTNETLKSEQILSKSLRKTVNDFCLRAHVSLEADLESTDFEEYAVNLRFELLNKDDVQTLINIVDKLPNFE